MRFVAAGCFIWAVLATRSGAQTSLSAHFDSLAGAELAKPHPDSLRLQRLAIVAYALARGAAPGRVTMSIAGRPMPFQIVGIEMDKESRVPSKHVRAVGWHDAAADTMIAIFAPINDGGLYLSVALSRGTTVDSGVAAHPAVTFSANVSDAPCTTYRLAHALVAESVPCVVRSATMAFTTLSRGGTLIASPEVTFGLTRVELPPTSDP